MTLLKLREHHLDPLKPLVIILDVLKALHIF